MLRNLKTLYGYKIFASDGEIGHVKDFYFDDQTWVVRYLVVNTGSWLPGRLVLIAPHAFGHLEDVDGKVMLINLTRQQIEYSPSIESHQPVSRQHEIEYYRYYGWPAYWDGGAMWGLGAFPTVMPPAQAEREVRKAYRHRQDKHLQSTRAVDGYAVQAVDGTVGQVSGLVVDDRSWAVHQLAVETGHWYRGKEILDLPHQIDRISYDESKVFVKLTKEAIQQTSEHKVAKAGAVT